MSRYKLQSSWDMGVSLPKTPFSTSRKHKQKGHSTKTIIVSVLAIDLV